MIRFILEKIKNKKGLNLCFLAGIVLLVAMLSCHPMLERCMGGELLLSAFEDYAEKRQQFPAVFSRSGSLRPDQYETAASVAEQMDSYEKKWTQYVDIETLASQQCIALLTGNRVDTNLGKKNMVFGIRLIRGMDDHIIVTKEASAETLKNALDAGAIPCMVSENALDERDLVIGEVLNFLNMEDSRGTPVKMVVSKIFKAADASDRFWHLGMEDFGKSIFISEEAFDRLVAEYRPPSITYEQHLMLDYTEIDCEREKEYRSYMEAFQEEEPDFSTNMLSTLKTYEKQQQSVRMILWVLELPCIVLLFLFLYMVADQIVHSEESEISVLRSRGVTLLQILRLYAGQAMFLLLIGIALGIVVGFLLCQLAARTDEFLHFTSRPVGFSVLTWRIVPFALAAGAIVLFFLLFCVWKKAKNTIVELTRADAGMGSKMFWEKYFLDVLLLAVSCYLLFNYSRQKDWISQRILNGEALDPLIFLDASLFIFACGLVFLRLTKYLIRLIDRVGKKRWSAAMYASFLQIIRTFRKQGFISIFLIMTVACGIFDANMAHTINENSERRIRYDVGCDERVQEHWTRYYKEVGDSKVWYYTEPDFGRFEELVDDGLCESITRVITDHEVVADAHGGKVEGCSLYGIHTREFGETAWMMDGLNDKHWFYALNALAENVNGVIISSNLAEKLGVSVGDPFAYTRILLDASATAPLGTICAIVDAFPGYNRYDKVEKKDGTVELKENYLIVGNYATIVSQFSMTPYEVWMKTAPSAGDGQIKAALLEKGMALDWYRSAQEEVEKNRGTALIQVTNGMFTTSFAVTLVVCVVGFLIYWIMSIQNRQMMFGIYRAMGMKMKEIQQMLVWEQVFGSLFPIVIGGVAGILETALFVPLIALVYLPVKHNIEIQVFLFGADILKLFAVVLSAVCVCGLVLRELLKKIKIAQALKLGED